jgi:hypothetical protein
MTSTDMEVARPVMPAADRLGQGTAVEMQRAVAEVQAAILVARQFPRDIQAALREMRQSCRQQALAERAFYRYPRGGQPISGPSVHLARELARCFQNLQYGLVELRRDDANAQSEMLVFAWDVQTNTRIQHTFIVPHLRDKTGGPVVLTDVRDIYEANANAGARRLREAIFAIVPPWFVQEAIQLCNQTLEDGGGVALPQRIEDAIKNFRGLGISQARMEAKVGRPVAEWDAHDVAQLGVSYQSLRQGTVTRDDEFPPEDDAVTAADVIGSAKPAAAPGPAKAAKAAAPAKAAPAKAAPGRRPPAPVSPGQLADLETERARLEYDDPAEWVSTVARIALVPDLAGIDELTAEQAAFALQQIRGKSRSEVTALAAGDGQGTLGSGS